MPLSEVPGFADRPRVGAGLERAAGGAVAGAARRTNACSMPARRPAARPARCWSWPAARSQLTAIDIDAQRLGRVADNLRRLGRDARLVQADLTPPPTLVGWRGLRCDPARCALLGDRRDPPPSGHQVAAPRERYGRFCDAPARTAARPAGRCCGPAAGCSMSPARCCQPRTSPVVARLPGGQSGWPSGRLPRGPGTALPPHGAVSYGWQLLPGAGGDGFYYACLTKRGRAPERRLRLMSTIHKGCRSLPRSCIGGNGPGARRRSPGRRARDPLRLRGAEPRRDHAVGARRLSEQRTARCVLKDGVTLSFDLECIVSRHRRLWFDAETVDARAPQRAVLPRGHRPLSAARCRQRRAGDLPDARGRARQRWARSRNGRSRSTRSCTATRPWQISAARRRAPRPHARRAARADVLVATPGIAPATGTRGHSCAEALGAARADAARLRRRRVGAAAAGAGAENSADFNRRQPWILLLNICAVLALGVLLARKLWQLYRGLPRPRSRFAPDRAHGGHVRHAGGRAAADRVPVRAGVPQLRHRQLVPRRDQAGPATTRWCCRARRSNCACANSRAAPSNFARSDRHASAARISRCGSTPNGARRRPRMSPSTIRGGRVLNFSSASAGTALPRAAAAEMRLQIAAGRSYVALQPPTRAAARRS